MNPIFNYFGEIDSATIGHEIILRAVEQEIRELLPSEINILLEPVKFAAEKRSIAEKDRNKYETLLAQLRFQQGHAALTMKLFNYDFYTRPKCMPWPPCEFDKEGDKIKIAAIKNIVLSRHTIGTFNFKITKLDGTEILTYSSRSLQEELPLEYQEYTYFVKDQNAILDPYIGDHLLFVVERYINGSETPEHVYNYKFELLKD